MTKVINLFGAPGSGKSTTAAGLYYQLKLQHKRCEMVREYVKSWAWEGRTPTENDQVYLFGKQTKYESLLYGKVDYIVTDSPLIIGGFYELYNDGNEIVGKAAPEFMKNARKQGVEYHNFWLPPHDRYDPEGRYHSQEEQVELAQEMYNWLTKHLDMTTLEGVPLNERVNWILAEIAEREMLKR